MSNYLEKYHLKKVQPVKSRTKINFIDYAKANLRPEKATTFKIDPEIKFKRTHKFEKEEGRKKLIQPKTQKIISNRLSKESNNKNADCEQLGGGRHKSLNFKSSKQISVGKNILNSLQNFFNNILKSDEGCSCNSPCKWGLIFCEWSDIPFEIVKEHYESLLSKFQTGESKETTNENSLGSGSKESREREEYDKYYKQIIKDVDRTQSQEDSFQKESFKKKSRNILICYAMEDAAVGYVQGMNMVLSGLLFHIKAQIETYAVFRKLIFSIRGIYLNHFEECYAHVETIEKHLQKNVNDLYKFFKENAFDLKMLCLPWLISLLTIIVPLSYLHLIYEGFFKQKWDFIYKVILAILIYHKETIKQSSDVGDIMVLLSPTNQQKHNLDWEDIILFASTFPL